MEHHFIYIIASSESGPSKIGISRDPQKRLKQLQTGHSAPLRIFHTAEVPAPRTRLLERIIHKTLNHYRASGEWFSLPVKDAIAEVTYALMRHEETKNLRDYV